MEWIQLAWPCCPAARWEIFWEPAKQRRCCWLRQTWHLPATFPSPCCSQTWLLKRQVVQRQHRFRFYWWRRPHSRSPNPEHTNICGQDTPVAQWKVQWGHILFICLPHPCLPLFLHLHLQCFGRLAQRKLGIRSRTQPYIGLWWHLWNSILLFGRGPIYQPPMMPLLGEPSIYIQLFTDFADLRPPWVPY